MAMKKNGITAASKTQPENDRKLVKQRDRGGELWKQRNRFGNPRLDGANRRTGRDNLLAHLGLDGV